MLEAVRLGVHERDWLGSEAAFDRVTTPHSVEHFFGGRAEVLMSVGRLSDAVEQYRDLIRFDPLASAPTFAFSLDCIGRHAEADMEAERMRRVGAAPYLVEYFGLLRAMVRDDVPTIEAQFRKYLAMDASYMPVHQPLIADLGNVERARRLLAQAFEDPFYQDSSHMTGLSQIAGFYGDHELALKCLVEAYVKRRGLTIVALWHPLIAGARRLPGFREIVRHLGLNDYWRKTGHWGDYARPLGADDFEMI
jgi:hypothetical protein